MSRRGKTYIFFWIGVLVMQSVALLRLLFEPHSGFDLFFYSSVYHISQYLFFQLIALAFFVIWLGYWAMHKSRRRVNRSLARAHGIITVGLLLFITLLNLTDYEYGPEVLTLMTILFTIVIAAQLLYIVNILITALSPRHVHHRKRKMERDIED